MKKYFILMASAALMLAVSCNKEEVNTPQTSNETELITVQINPETKTSLGDDGATKWLDGDAISVTVGDKNIGTLNLVNAAEGIFSGEVESGYNGDAILNYPAGVTEVPAEQKAEAGSFANGAALLEGTTTMEALRAGEGVTLSNKTALLQFTVAQAGDVTFEVGENEYTVTGCQTGATYYACVAPASDVTFVARINGYLSKQAPSNVSFAASTIAALETLPAPVKSTWGVVGSMTNWADGSDIAMYKEGDYEFVKNVVIASTDEFKFRENGAWDNQISGGIVAPNTVRSAGWVNMTISEAGTYDIYIDAKNSKYYIMTPGKTPIEANNPTDITITVIYEGTDRDYLHMWSDGGEVANNMKYTDANPYKWTVTIPAGDQQNRDYQVILKKGSEWGNAQTADSEKMCLRNPMTLTVSDNKAVHE